MDTTERRIAHLERTTRRDRVLALAFGAALGVSVMLGLNQEQQPSLDGFTAVMGGGGGMSYFRLVDRDTVEILDTSRGDRWFWRRIRNWPDPR